MESLGAGIEGTTKARFASETAPDGSAWAPLAASTVARRRKRSRGILKDTGRLMGSITHFSDATSAIVGTSVFYAIFHQYGVEGDPDDATSTDLTARPFLGIGDDERRVIREVVDEWVRRNFA